MFMIKIREIMSVLNDITPLMLQLLIFILLVLFYVLVLSRAAQLRTVHQRFKNFISYWIIIVAPTSFFTFHMI